MAEADTRLWSVVVFLGVGVGISLGAVFVMLRTSRRELNLLPAVSTPSPNALGEPLMMDNVSPRGVAHKSAARTMTASPVPAQLLRAIGTRPWRIQVRAVSPPGGIAIFSTGNNPAEGVTLNTGDFQEMWLGPGEDLYVQSQSGQVVVSVSGGEAV